MKNSSITNLEAKIRFLRKETIKRIKPSDIKDFCARFNNFVQTLKTRWEKSSKRHERFLEQNKDWLDASISFVPPPPRTGRRKLSFEESSEKTKAKKCKIIRDNTSLPVLAHAAQMSFRKSGQPVASKILKEIIKSPTKAKKYQKSLKEVKPHKLSAEEALGVLIEGRLSRHSYNVIRKAAPEKFPSYTIVQNAKLECYPKRECITISEICSKVSLQGLLNHTVERLVLLQKHIIDSLDTDELPKIVLYSKWGFDGSSGHSSYKQAFLGPDSSDSSVFITSLVPLKMVCLDKIIWQNPRPSSTRFCRPLKIEYTKETSTISKLEKARVEEEKKLIRFFCYSWRTIGKN